VIALVTSWFVSVTAYIPDSRSKDCEASVEAVEGITNEPDPAIVSETGVVPTRALTVTSSPLVAATVAPGVLLTWHRSA
jgi:hypothetical protein